MQITYKAFFLLTKRNSYNIIYKLTVIIATVPHNIEV